MCCVAVCGSVIVLQCVAVCFSGGAECPYICIYICSYIYVYVYIYTYVYKYIYTYVYIHTNMYVGVAAVRRGRPAISDAVVAQNAFSRA